MFIDNYETRENEIDRVMQTCDARNKICSEESLPPPKKFHRMEGMFNY